MKRSLKGLLLAGAAGLAVAGCASDPYYYDSSYYYESPRTYYYAPGYYDYGYYGPRYYSGPSLSLGFGYSRHRWR